MDEMRITSKFTTGMISKLTGLALKKKLGCDIGIRLNEVRATVDDGKTHVHLDIDAELAKEDLLKILKGAGLD